MSLIKFTNQNKLFPWTNESLKNLFSTDDFFSNDFLEENSLMPAMNVKELEKDYEIEFAAPGFLKDDFEVTIDHNMLNVSGNKTKEKEEKEDGYTRKEFSYNSFKRSLKLPEFVNTAAAVKATYENGILKLNLHKNEKMKKETKKVIKVL